MIEFELRLDRPSFRLAAQAASDSHRIGLFGPSGAGKTTLIRALAGLEASTGAIRFGGEVWQESDSSSILPAHRRRIGWVPQGASLFPHLDVRGNLTFSQTFDRDRFDEIVNVLALDNFLGRRPETLSGGEAKRVALGRALLSSPRLLLLDEPLAGLDWPRRHELLGYLLRTLERVTIPAILVSHDPFEVGVFCEHVWLMEAGQITASGSPEDIFLHPRGKAQAQLAGVENIWTGTVVESRDEFATVRIGAQTVTAERPASCSGDSVTVVVAAAEILIAREHPRSSSARNVWKGTVSEIRPQGREVLVRLICGESNVSTLLTAMITPAALAELELACGDQVHALFKATAVHIY